MVMVSSKDLNTMSKEHGINSPSTLDERLIQPLQPQSLPLAPNLPCADLLNGFKLMACFTVGLGLKREIIALILRRNRVLTCFWNYYEGSREDFIMVCVPLCDASLRGDWQAARVVIDKRPELVRFAITENLETALHVAVSAESTKLMEDFVQNVVNLMERKDLELQNKYCNTALCSAAAAGSVKVAEIMMKKNKALLDIPGSDGMMPLYFAASFGKHDMARYLYDNSQRMTGDFWTHKNRGLVLVKCIETDMFDIALKIVTDPGFTIDQSTCHSLLNALARKPDACNRRERNIIQRVIESIFAITHLKVGPAEKDGHALTLLRIIWGIIMKMSMADIDDILRGPASPAAEHQKRYSSRVLFVAAKRGNTGFLVELLRGYRDLVWKTNDDNQSIFHIAIKHRHEGIYNLLYEIGSMKDLIFPLKDKNGNNMLHLVGKTSNKKRNLDASQASLQMQRELLWFKEVEKMLPPVYRKRKNKDFKTPYELFYENNTDLFYQGLNWVYYCMVVATLIITTTFGIAFAVPVGYNQVNGTPIFLHEGTLLVFVIADAISLFSASASVLVFLSVVTSRHDGDRYFFESLPRMLMVGLVTLFISIMALMITFSVSLFVIYHNRLKWVPILVSVFAAVPVLLFVKQQFSSFVDMFRSTYDARYLFKPKRRMLCIRNPRF